MIPTIRLTYKGLQDEGVAMSVLPVCTVTPRGLGTLRSWVSLLAERLHHYHDACQRHMPRHLLS